MTFRSTMKPLQHVVGLVVRYLVAWYKLLFTPSAWSFIVVMSLVSWLPAASVQSADTLPTQSATSGMTATFQRENETDLLVVRSPDHFELHLDNQGILAWYDLQRDPERNNNLVADDARLLEHRFDSTNALPSGKLTLQEQTPVWVHVQWQAALEDAAQPATFTYTIWAGGQIAVTLHTPVPLTTTLNRRPEAITGATLQTLDSMQMDAGTTTQSLMLFLDAWTGETPGLPTQPEGAALTEDNDIDATSGIPLRFNPTTGAITGRASADQSVRLQLPADAILRQPRFEITDWPSANLTVRRDQTILVEGADYLAHWNADTSTLSFQYLYPLIGETDSASTFELTAEPAAPTLRLGIAGKQVDERGYLVVDGNMPDVDGQDTSLDIFRIPYIQNSSRFKARATLQGGGRGVKFVLSLGANRIQTIVDRADPYEATFTLTTFGEYKLAGYILDSQGRQLNAEPDAIINPLGYGHIIVSIGDSITAGVGGNTVKKGADNYPVTRWERSPQHSRDKRNIYQYNNKNRDNQSFYRSYQVNLNNLLTQCSAAPVFILNSGFGGIRTARSSNNNALDKIPAYSDHIKKLGARRVLLQIGTNDVSAGLSPDAWSDDVQRVIDELQAANPGITIWVARLPWRSDGDTKAQRTAAYNERIPAIVEEQNTAENPVRLGADFYQLFENNPDLLDQDDELHPTQEGYVAMADRWSSTLCPTLPRPAPLIFEQLLPFVRR